MKKLILAITLSLAISTNAHSFCFEMCTGTSGSGASSLAELSDWPAAVSATEVGYLDGLGDTILNLLAAKESSTSNNIDPDRISGDTVDDNLLDAAAIANPLTQSTSGTAGGLSGTPDITVDVVTYNGTVYTCLPAAPGSPTNGHRACADGDNWQPGGATQGTNNWIVEWNSVAATWKAVHDVTNSNDVVSSEVAAKLNRYHQTAHVNPDVVYANNAGIIVLDPKTAADLTLAEIAVYLDEDPTTELTITCYHKTAAIGYTGGTQVDANDTVAGTFTANSNFDDATIPAGSKFWCVIGDDPDATTTDLEISTTGTYD